jgi:hypothetical protein
MPNEKYSKCCFKTDVYINKQLITNNKITSNKRHYWPFSSGQVPDIYEYVPLKPLLFNTDQYPLPIL